MAYQHDYSSHSFKNENFIPNNKPSCSFMQRDTKLDFNDIPPTISMSSNEFIGEMELK